MTNAPKAFPKQSITMLQVPQNLNDSSSLGELGELTVNTEILQRTVH